MKPPHPGWPGSVRLAPTWHHLSDLPHFATKKSVGHSLRANAWLDSVNGVYHPTSSISVPRDFIAWLIRSVARPCRRCFTCTQIIPIDHISAPRVISEYGPFAVGSSHSLHVSFRVKSRRSITRNPTMRSASCRRET